MSKFTRQTRQVKACEKTLARTLLIPKLSKQSTWQNEREYLSGRDDQESLSKSSSGRILILVLVFTVIFVLLGGGILQLVSISHKTSLREVNLKKAFHIAEAGINYYRWRLAHLPDDYGGAGDYDYTDPYGEVIGHYTLEITPPEDGSTIVIVTSHGYVNDDPSISRTIEARFGKPALSSYAFLSNSSVWFGEGEEVGKLHSNGGIRMDGVNDSTVESPLEEYFCYPMHGCNPPYEIKPGVWGEGEGNALWRFPPEYDVTAIDFEAVTIDLSEMKDRARNGGLYLAPSSRWGYHLAFEFDGTVNIYEVNRVYRTYGCDTSRCNYLYIDIASESFVNSYNYNSLSEPIIFVEEQAWVSGELQGRITVASADFINPGVETDIIIAGDITYRNKDGTDSLGLIAQGDILVPLLAPDELEINAALLAQGGHCFMYYYPSWYGSFRLKDKIELYGTIITNTTWTWSWVNYAGGPVVSGYEETETAYDPYLTYIPPPYFPTKEEYELISWREIP